MTPKDRADWLVVASAWRDRSNAGKAPLFYKLVAHLLDFLDEEDGGSAHLRLCVRRAIQAMEHGPNFSAAGAMLICAFLDRDTPVAAPDLQELRMMLMQLPIPRAPHVREPVLVG